LTTAFLQQTSPQRATNTSPHAGKDHKLPTVVSNVEVQIVLTLRRII